MSSHREEELDTALQVKSFSMSRDLPSDASYKSWGRLDIDVQWEVMITVTLVKCYTGQGNYMSVYKRSFLQG